jgi:hypothetical protein
MKKYKGYKKSCNVLKIEDVACDINGFISIEDNYRIFFEIMNLSKEQLLMLKDERAKFLYAKTDDNYITATALHMQHSNYKHNTENTEGVISAMIEAENAFFGNEFIEVDQNDIFFEGFTCKVTDSNEIIGITPYESLEDEIRINTEGFFKVTAKIKTIGNLNGLSFFTYPHIYREETEIRLGYQSVIQYQVETTSSLDEIKDKLHDILLLFKILSGEYVSTTSVTLFHKTKSYDFLGNCNFPKYDLLLFKNNTFDTRYYLRKALFKISDFKDIDKLYKEWEKIIQNNKLAFMSYRELLLDEEMKIFSANKFLKVMQIIEGIEREDVSEEENSKFNQHKEMIIEMLTDKGDKEFIRQWCIYNKGDNFRKCLKRFIYFGLKTLSRLSNTQCEKYSKNIIDSIKNDRDTYTHASHYSHPILSDDTLSDIVYVFRVFFRLRILIMLGIDDELIRNRLSFDRSFVRHYHKLFNLKIETNNKGYHDTGEFDNFMWDF